MMRAGEQIHTLSSALRNFSRDHTMDVLRAYDRLVRLEEREMKSTLPPRNHALWIHGLNLGAGVLVVDVAHAHRMSNDLSLTGRVTTPPVADVPVDDFDPTRHALLCTDVSLASYLEGNPDGLLGANARVVSPYFKLALVWWTD